MKTLKEGNKEVLKEYKYFKCRKCGWIGKAEKSEYIYVPGEYIYIQVTIYALVFAVMVMQMKSKNLMKIIK